MFHKRVNIDYVQLHRLDLQSAMYTLHNYLIPNNDLLSFNYFNIT